jgi:hypothetical protein
VTTASTDIIRGTADMLILKLLEGEPMHGWGCTVTARKRDLREG